MGKQKMLPKRVILAHRLLSIIFPPRCASCRAPLPIPCYKLLCRRCMAGIIPITGPICKQCGRPFETSSGPDHICSTCIAHPPPFTLARSMFQFSSTIKELIHRFKYQGDLCAMECLTHAAINWMKTNRWTTIDADTCILPIPLHKKKLQQRGFNQAAMLAHEIFGRTKVRTGILEKTRHTPSQVGLPAKERHKNLSGAFACRPLPSNVTRIIIFDDVFTTGATAAHTALAVRKTGIRDIKVLALARTP